MAASARFRTAPAEPLPVAYLARIAGSGRMGGMQSITPHLWFDRQAKQAAEFYTSAIPGSRITRLTTLRNTPSGDCALVWFELAGQPFAAISAGPLFKFNPSVSFHARCSAREEVDALVGKALRGRQGSHAARFLSFQRALWLDAGPFRPFLAGDLHRRQRVPAARHACADVCGRCVRQGGRSHQFLRLGIQRSAAGQ